MRTRAIAAVLAVAAIVSCRSQAPASRAGSADATFAALSREILEDYFARHPSAATDLGIHKYDERLDDRTPAAIQAEVSAAQAFRNRLAVLDASTLTLQNALDREQLVHAMDATVLSLDVIKRWAKDPDLYSSDITNAAYVIMKREYAPAATRLKALIAREKLMPAALQTARANLTNAVPVYARIAVEQVDGNISFFKNDVPAAFTSVTDQALLSEFTQANAAVMAALDAYKGYVRDELLPKAAGSFAYGSDVYLKALAANELVDMPLDRLLQIAEQDRAKNEAAFQATARQIDATKPPDAVLASLQVQHPAPNRLLQETQGTLDAIRQFLIDHRIVTIPPSDPLKVKETPPFMRSTTSASMDTPGPFEPAPLRAFYNMTLPDPRTPQKEQDDFMRQWYDAMTVNVSVHEVYPGHYIQFLYVKSLPSDVRKVFGAATNSEGWAHYCEQMMQDEGFHGGDPRYRLAQLQDALLRDVRFIAGIRMHTQGMTVEEATTLFETAGHQPHPVAVSEAKRGTSDALYGYYTLGKLMILKLRDDYRAKVGSDYSLQRFHDAMMQLGPLPLPLVRRALLGEVGTVL